MPNVYITDPVEITPFGPISAPFEDAMNEVVTFDRAAVREAVDELGITRPVEIRPVVTGIFGYQGWGGLTATPGGWGWREDRYIVYVDVTKSDDPILTGEDRPSRVLWHELGHVADFEKHRAAGDFDQYLRNENSIRVRAQRRLEKARFLGNTAYQARRAEYQAIPSEQAAEEIALAHEDRKLTR